jgi:hypothetical protein
MGHFPSHKWVNFRATMTRAEALLSLRCIEINGDWDALLEFVTARRRRVAANEQQAQPLLLTSAVAQLPIKIISYYNIAH